MIRREPVGLKSTTLSTQPAKRPFLQKLEKEFLRQALATLLQLGFPELAPVVEVIEVDSTRINRAVVGQ